jgi:hypothetical protein
MRLVQGLEVELKMGMDTAGLVQGRRGNCRNPA